jgi:hypothetical protein
MTTLCKISCGVSIHIFFEQFEIHLAKQISQSHDITRKEEIKGRKCDKI